MSNQSEVNSFGARYISDTTNTIDTDLTQAENDIASQLILINTNITDIGNAETDITNLQTDVGLNTTQLAINTPAITTLQTDVGLNTTQLAINTPAITTLQTDLGLTNTAVGVNSGNISGNTGSINTLIANYNKTTISDTWTNGNGTTASTTVEFSRYNDIITALIPSATSLVTVGVGPSYAFGSILPVELRPSINIDCYARILAGPAGETGFFQVTSAGNLNCFRSPNGTLAFSAVAQSGFFANGFGYSLD